VEFDGERLSDAEVFNELLLLNDGGADTTRYVITGGVKALLDRPEQRELLSRRSELLPGAVEECLRWVTPIVNMARATTRDLELHGVTIPKGDGVLLLYGAANFDDRVFADPDRFDVERGGKHLAFGFGTHFCLGAHLARLEVRVMLDEILRRFPDLTQDGDIHYSPTAFVRGIDHLPVRWSPNES
jgi:cholest-4-en-3-one 26-monooxygenase